MYVLYESQQRDVRVSYFVNDSPFDPCTSRSYYQLRSRIYAEHALAYAEAGCFARCPVRPESFRPDPESIRPESEVVSPGAHEAIAERITDVHYHILTPSVMCNCRAVRLFGIDARQHGIYLFQVKKENKQKQIISMSQSKCENNAIYYMKFN